MKKKKLSKVHQNDDSRISVIGFQTCGAVMGLRPLEVGSCDLRGSEGEGGLLELEGCGFVALGTVLSTVRLHTLGSCGVLPQTTQTVRQGAKRLSYKTGLS